MDIFRKKTVESLDGTAGKLNRTLGALDLTALGVGAVIGTGIFVLTGVAAAMYAGPGLIISFIIAALTCVLSALCYAEFASTVPVSGSAYAYSYFVFGEIIAWILGWDLILEYGVAAATVASGWSSYFTGFLDGFGLHLPAAISGAYDASKGSIIDLPAVLITLAITYVLSKGTKKTARFNGIMVVVKMAVILLFIGVGAFYVKPANWSPFLPFGFSGVISGAATVFVAYIGFDAVSTAAEEVKRPQRDMPIGIIASLVICTLLYIAVSLVLTGIVPYYSLNVGDPVAYALRFMDKNFLAGFISIGAIAGMTTVLLVMLFGMTRLLFAISRDGLLTSKLSTVSSKAQTPTKSIWVTGAIIAILSGFVPLSKLASLTSIGSLFAFAVVSLGIIALRKSDLGKKSSFRVPWVPVIPLLSAAACVYLMTNLHLFTWMGFLIWMLIGLIIYFLYGKKHSLLNQNPVEKREHPERKL
ncbi:amino acid permease [Paenibacillus sp.]|jgi:APA family basic amino acid/polyamine antiporter|uniref:amino acid permease n=1 Tax=Paenibacillus sp. TaxID=58172 RepID=UPI00281D8E73|nr:amino acid permease [Paenibacillus sp.]MDR0267562.1 amino acid permease [Paenibacillus sp.]